MSGCLDERANAAVESFRAILQSAADREQAARQDALRWRQDAVDLQRQVKDLQQKYEQQVKRAEMFSKLVSNVSGKLDAAHTIDRGHITTITETDETSSPHHADVNLAAAEMASAQTAQQAPADGPVLPKVRVSSQMEPNKGSLPASRQNSLPDLGLPRMTRKRSSNLRPGARAGARGSLMESASSGSLKRQGSPVRTTVGSLASWLMAYTMMQDNPKQRAAAQQINGWSDNPENVDISAVSVLDDDGASGVGAAAAAAVSVALARSWASAASQKQAAMVERTTSGSLKPGRAGFRLVAAVSNTDLARLAKDATPKGGSTPHKVPSTPPFTSPREQTIHHQHSTSLNSQQSGSVLSGSTPFASLSGCPFPDGDMSSVCTTIMEQVSEKGRRGGSRQGGLGVGTERAPLSQSVGSERAPFSQGDTPSSMPSSASFQTAGSLPILAESSQIMHRRAEFAAGTGTLPPAGNGVAPTRISPMLPQTQILKDTRHRRDAYARGVGDIPPPPPKVVLEPTLSSDSADSLAGQDGSTQLPNGRDLTDPAAAGPSDPAEPVPQRQQLPPTPSIEAARTRSAALPPGRTGLPHTESFNTDVVQENLERHRSRRQQQQQEGGRGLSHTGSHLQLHWLSRPRTVLVVAKPSPEVLLSLVNVVFWLLQRDTTVYVEPSIFHRMTESIKVRTAAGLKPGNLVTWLPEPETGEIPRPVADRLDWVITLGGDGTVLWTCSILGNGPVPPLVPFAMGSLGFMTPFAMDRMQKVLTKIMDGGFSLMLRHRLHCKIERADNTGYLGDGYVPVADVNTELDEQVVLNEVVIDRGVSPFLCNLECYCDGNFVTHVQGDGLIVATPTGSTAYNLAAGGSMVHPQVPGVLFTPINPHSLSSRPLILPESIQIRVRVPHDSRSEMWCSFDGKDRQRLAPGDSVLIFMSQHPIPTVCKLDASHDWFLSMSDGLHWNLRKRQAGAGK